MPHGLGPKGASKIHRLSNFSKEYEVCQYALRKPLNKKVRNLEPKHPRISILLLKLFCNTNVGLLL